MLTKHSTLLLWLVFLAWGLTMFFVACGDAQLDNNPPDVRINRPFEGAIVYAGDSMSVEIILEDDVSLANFTMRVHEDTRPHTEDAPSNIFDWDTTVTLQVFGQRTELTMLIPLPIELPSSECHLVVDCVDDSGNWSQSQTVQFDFINNLDNQAPEITLDKETIVAFSGTPFTVLGLVTDNKSLDQLTYTIKDGNGAIIHEATYSIDGLLYQILEFFTAPNAKAFYTIEVNAWDDTHNQTMSSIVLDVR